MRLKMRGMSKVLQLICSLKVRPGIACTARQKRLVSLPWWPSFPHRITLMSTTIRPPSSSMKVMSWISDNLIVPPILTGYRTSWMSSHGPCLSLVKRVRSHFYSTTTVHQPTMIVTDMLVAVLNTCTKEELEESDEEIALVSQQVTSDDSVERRKVIKNKIMAVGRMARVFALLRYVPSCT